MEAIHHISEAALTDDPEKAMAEIAAAQDWLERMREEIRRGEGEKARPVGGAVAQA